MEKDSFTACGGDEPCCAVEKDGSENEPEKIYESVQKYYGEIIKTTDDLATSCCLVSDISMRPKVKAIRAQIHPEVLASSYGCGSPVPFCLEACLVLDLGSGAGIDCFVCSAMVGPQGRVIGVDMTQEQLIKARAHIDYHTRIFGLPKPNVEFRFGVIEDLRGAGIADSSVDVVISNCVINLSPSKQKVFEEIHRVLKKGGEMFISDVFCDRRIPETLQKDPVLWGECLSGALYWEDFRRSMLKCGFNDIRVVEESAIAPGGKIGETLKEYHFVSRTVNAFKSDHIEDRCEDYGQVAIYNGTIAECPDKFVLDEGHIFEKGRQHPVCGNTASMLTESRYGPHFTVTPRGAHRGLFPDCASTSSTITAGAMKKGSCC